MATWKGRCSLSYGHLSYEYSGSVSVGTSKVAGAEGHRREPYHLTFSDRTGGAGISLGIKLICHSNRRQAVME
jgi:hypothetical protein